MDLPILFILAAVLLLAIRADPIDQGPQRFSNSPPATAAPLQEKNQQERQPKYEEVILYLTPSQIRAYESGKGLMSHQQAAELRALEENHGSMQPHQPIQYGGLQAEQSRDPAQQNIQFGGVEAGQELTKHKQRAKFPGLQLELRLADPMQMAQHPSPNSLDLLQINDHLNKQMQNIYHGASQNMKNEEKKKDNKQSEHLQLQETRKQKSTKDKTSQQLEPENTPQSPRQDLQKREKYIELSVPQQLIPQELSHLQQHYPPFLQHLKQQLFTQTSPQFEQQHIHMTDPHLAHFPLHHEKTELGPQNYAYLYFYPHGKPIHSVESQHLSPLLEQHPKELFVQPQQYPIFQFQPKFQLIPYEYAYQNKLEAQQILQAQLPDHELNAHHLEAHKLEPHQLEDFNIQQLLIQKNLEPNYQQQKQINLEEQKIEPQELKLKIIATSREQKPKEIKVDLKKLNGYHQQDIMEVYKAQKLKAKIEAEEKEAHRLDAQLKAEELKAERFKAEQLKEELFNSQEFRDELFNSPEFRDELFKNQGFKNNLFQNQEFKNELFKHQEFKEELFKNHEHKPELIQNHEPQENIFNTQEPKEQLFKTQSSDAKVYKSEYQDLDYLQKLEPKRTQMYSILNPLFQGHSITESLQHQKVSFPHHTIHLETGFKPLQYAPKFYDVKYAREIEKILKRNRVEKQKAMAKAAAIANEPPEKIIIEHKPVEIVKQVEVPVPTPVMVPVPTGEVKVPQPYPIPVEIIRTFPVSILKTQKVEVQKPVPVEIEKRVPVPVTKNVYVKVDKPFFVPKVVPVEVKREIPVPVPIKTKNPLKLAIIKHVWNK